MTTLARARTARQGLALIFLLIVVPLVQAQAVPPTWTQLSPASGPTGREAHSAVYDAKNNSMIVFGGRNASGDLNEVWVLSNADGTGGSPSWTRLATSGASPARAFHSAVYDSANNRMIVFGGEPYSNDVWVLSNANGRDATASTWAQLTFPATASLPNRRLGHSAVYDAASNKMIVFAGEMFITGGYTATLDDVWVLSNANGLGGPPTWTQLSIPVTAGISREMHSAVYDASQNRMVVFGGFANFALANDVWVLSNANGVGGTPAWTKLAPTGTLPAGREMHSAVYDQAANRMTIFGGNANYAFANDVWALTNANGLGGTPAWTQLAPTGGPTVRWAQSAVNRAGTMIVFGGHLMVGWANDVWVLSSGAQDLAVQILIQPGEDRPATIEIEPDNDDLIVVAILSSPTFDPLTMVDRTSLTFGRTGNESSLAFCYDSDRDDQRQVGTHALICKFYIQKAGFQPTDTRGVLMGKTVAGASIRGEDSIRIESETGNDDGNNH